jgi:aerobic carbon-monoxide dehydrogenase small subunit
MISLSLTINGETYLSHRDPMTPLVDILREDLALTGAKTVCREGFCGACMVLMDGRPAVSCLTPAALAAGRDIRTVEGLRAGDEPTPLQAALEAHDVVQCGMCFPGMVVTLTSFLADNPNPTRQEIKQALVGNICRCTGYERIIEAVLAHAEAMRG